MEKIIQCHLQSIAVGVSKDLGDQLSALNDPGLASGIIEDLGALSDKVRVLPVSGNEQKATLTGLLKEPIVVEVVYDGETGSVPVTAFPMTVGIKDPEKAVAVPHGETTDGKGRFSFDLQELKATGAASNTVRVALDFRAVEKQTSLDGPSTEVTYFMPTKDTTRIGVIIHETIDGRENTNPHTGSAIKKALTDIGFQVIRVETGADLTNLEVVRMSRDSLASRFGGVCDYLVVGTAETELSSKEGVWIFYMSRLVIDALELDTGKTIHFEVPMGQQTKASHKTEARAARNSLNKAAEVMTGDPDRDEPGLLLKKFIARFEEGADWSDEDGGP
jgi:hypothetical protein